MLHHIQKMKLLPIIFIGVLSDWHTFKNYIKKNKQLNLRKNFYIYVFEIKSNFYSINHTNRSM